MELNNSGREVRGPRVLLKVKRIGKKNEKGDHTEGGLIIPQDIWERRQMNVVIGQIINHGANAWHDYKDPYQVGDYVVFKRYAGYHIEGDDGEAYRSILDIDVVCKTNSDKEIGVIG